MGGQNKIFHSFILLFLFKNNFIIYRDPMLIIYATLNFHILFTFIYKILKNEISIKSQMLNQSSAVWPILSRENSKQSYCMSAVQLSSTIHSHALMELFWNQTTIGEKMEINCFTGYWSFSWFTVSESRWSQKLCGRSHLSGPKYYLSNGI